MDDLSTRLVNKSTEAFVMGIEIYNKPTIKYRVEGFSFFICNAWELMLKAELINRSGENSIYFKNGRTLSLEAVIKKIFTNSNDPMRKNLERIIELRNISTHLVTEDYERIYAPLFQSCVLNYINKMEEFHNRDITQHIAQNFLTLSIRPEDLTDNEIKAKYSAPMAKKLIKSRKQILSDMNKNNSSFAIPIQTTLAITKNRKEADLLVSVVGESGNDIRIVEKMKDPSSVYTLTTSSIVKLVNRRLKALNILLTKIEHNELVKKPFTTYDFQLFAKFYDLKNDSRYSYYSKLGKRYGYSQKTLDFIIEIIQRDPEGIIRSLKSSLN